VNLAVNARDAMPRGRKVHSGDAGRKIRRDLAGQHQNMAPGKYVVLIASDTQWHGHDDAHANIRTFFHHQGTGQRHWPGLGHGLWHREAERGHILVYSEPGHGTTFKIYLPNADHKIGINRRRSRKGQP